MIVTVYEGSHASQQFYTFFKSSLRHKKIGKVYVLLLSYVVSITSFDLQ